MPHEEMIRLSAKKNVPQTLLYTKTYKKLKPSDTNDTLICVPGGPGNDHSSFDVAGISIAQAFSPYLNVVLFDPRGCGKSQNSAAEHCTLEHYIDDIEAIRSHFKIPSDRFVLFGKSYGSIAALGYAIKYAAHLKKLLLLGGAVSGEFLNEAKQNLMAIGTPEQKRMAEKLWTGTFTGSAEEAVEYFQVMGPLYSRFFKPGVPISSPYNPEILNLGFRRFLREFDYRSQLRNVTCQTLILWGEDEWLFGRKQIEGLHKGIKKSELAIFPECGHLLWIDRWDKFLATTLAFLTNAK